MTENKKSDLSDKVGIEVSFKPGEPVRTRVFEIKEGSRVTAKPGNIVNINGRKEYIVSNSSRRLKTISFDEEGRAIEATRSLNNRGQLLSFNECVECTTYNPTSNEYKRFLPYREILIGKKMIIF